MVGGVKALVLLLVVVCVGCGTTSPTSPTTTSWVSDPNDPNNVKIEGKIRQYLDKPTSELTKADLEEVLMLYLSPSGTGLQLTNVKGLEQLTQLTELRLDDNQLTSVKGLENLTQLKELSLDSNYDLTKAQITELQKALPKCKITHDAKK